MNRDTKQQQRRRALTRITSSGHAKGADAGKQASAPSIENGRLASLTEQNVLSLAELHRDDIQQRTFAEKAADAITYLCTSISFLIAHSILIGIWVYFGRYVGDPFPYQLLTLLLSIEAIFLSTFILISQNRQQQLTERLHALDLQINLLAEQENTKSLAMLREIMEHLGVPFEDLEAEGMLEPTDPKKVIEEIDRSIHKKPS